jgi:hypothetical protein
MCYLVLVLQVEEDDTAADCDIYGGEEVGLSM